MLNDQRKGKGRHRTAGPDQPGLVLPMPQPMTLIQRRVVEAAGLLGEHERQEVTFQHSIFCQTSLPYRDPGPDVREWARHNGQVHLEVIAGKAMHPELGRLVPLGLPFGPKPRLILAHLNAEAKRTGSPEVEIEDSLTAFVKRLKLDPKGRNMRIIKDQLARLSASSIRFGMVHDGQAFTVNSQIVTAFNLWFPKNDRQKVLWPSTVRLSLEYFDSLRDRAVPLEERALAALSHSAMALDIYAWLVQRLHRIPKPHQQMVAWTLLHQQFGPDYARLRKFREVFLAALRQVHAVYPAAGLNITDEGLILRTSPPPIAKTGTVVRLPGT